MPFPNRDRHGNRTAINAVCAGRLPSDWLLRWDASTDKETLTYLTDEATNDVDSLTMRQGKYEHDGDIVLSDTGVASVYPSFELDSDGLPNLHCNDDGGLNTGNLQTQNYRMWQYIDDAVDLTVFLVVRYPDLTGEGISNHYSLVGGDGYRFGNVGDVNLTPTCYSAGGFRSCTNDFDDRRMIQIGQNTHNGTDDNDSIYYVGKTTVHSSIGATDASMNGNNFISMGSYSDASNSTWDMDCRIYEVIYYDRSLTTAEREGVVDYLSAKWDVTNADNASDTISSTSEEQWASAFDDVLGIQATNTPVARSITPLPNRDIPFASGTNINDPKFAINLIDARAATTNGKQYFTADDVEKMTWSGSGYPEVDYLDNVFGGLWNASAGVDVIEVPGGHNYLHFDTTTATITNNQLINGLAYDGWGYAVVAHGPDAYVGQKRVLTVDSLRYWYYGQYNSWGSTNGPMFYGKNASTAEGPQHKLAWEGGTTITGEQPHGDLDRKHLVCWKWDLANKELTWWRNGMWMCTREIDAVYAAFSTAVHLSLGATYTSALGHPDMKAWEAGFWVGSAANTITDAEMEDLQKNLCQKHDLDYMPDHTPFMMGGGGGSALSTASTMSNVWWFRADDDSCGVNRWWTDACDGRFATPYDVNSTDGVGEPVKEFAYGRECMTFDSGSGMHDATTYTWTESTVCGYPWGYSAYVIAELTDAATPVSNGYAADTTGIQVRRNGTTDKWDCKVAGATMTSASSYENKLVLIVGTYDFAEQTARAYINEETLSDSSPTVSSLGAATISIGQDSAGSNNGDVRVFEVGAFKHKLTDPDIDNLLKYARQRYDAPFT